MDNEITINGVEYVRKDSTAAPMLADMEYVVVRTCSAGAFAGYLEFRKGKEALLRSARRIWYWEGAASLSQLATDGTCKPDACKFPQAVDKVILTEIVEVLSVTAKAMKSIKAVPVWSAGKPHDGPAGKDMVNPDGSFAGGSASSAGETDGTGDGSGHASGSGLYSCGYGGGYANGGGDIECIGRG